MSKEIRVYTVPLAIEVSLEDGLQASWSIWVDGYGVYRALYIHGRITLDPVPPPVILRALDSHIDTIMTMMDNPWHNRTLIPTRVTGTLEAPPLPKA